jgi:hypothetical protein
MRAHLRYLTYVLRHKWFVLVAGLRVGVPVWRLLAHDLSKFSPAEWGPYVANFYRFKVGETVLVGAVPCIIRKRRHGSSADLGVEIPGAGGMPYIFNGDVEGYSKCLENFDRAWLHHQHHNPHHWQHWLLTGDDGEVRPLKMPQALAREMVADWMGAGRAITGRWEAGEWYLKHRGQINLHPDTRRLVEKILGVPASA